MSIEIADKVWKTELYSPLQKIVLLAMATETDERGVTSLTKEQIASMCDISVDTASYVIDVLEKKSFVIVVNNGYLVNL